MHHERYAIGDILLKVLKFKFMSIFTKHDMSTVSYYQTKIITLIFYSLCIELLGLWTWCSLENNAHHL